MCAANASAEVRTLETVGTLPLKPGAAGGIIPRDAAIEQALREAVIRIAHEFMADRPLGTTTDESGEGEVPLLTLPADDPTGVGTQDGPDAERDAAFEKLDRVLGKKMVPYTTRFRVIEDRGRRPALFSDDPEVAEEYVVIVEVQVDVARVRSRLVEAGLVSAGSTKVLANEILLEVEGLRHYAAYLDFRNLLLEQAGANEVVPVEMSQGHTVFDVATEVTAVEFLEALLTATPPHIDIDPIHASGGRLRVTVRWQPSGPDPAGIDAGVEQGG
ncbi:MAG: hypothetical protein QF570_18265 [Myxococcota bacterium]|nr:hypothetical protein [Myxococcota bacterium]